MTEKRALASTLQKESKEQVSRLGLVVELRMQAEVEGLQKINGFIKHRVLMRKPKALLTNRTQRRNTRMCDA